jgi:hypothetical protein
VYLYQNRTAAERLRDQASTDQVTVDLNLSEGLLRDLEEMTPSRGLQSREALIRAYVREGLRQDIERRDRGERLEPFEDDDELTREGIMELAVDVLGSEASAREWLASPQQLMPGKSVAPDQMGDSQWELSQIAAALKHMGGEARGPGARVSKFARLSALRIQDGYVSPLHCFTDFAFGAGAYVIKRKRCLGELETFEESCKLLTFAFAFLTEGLTLPPPRPYGFRTGFRDQT